MILEQSRVILPIIETLKKVIYHRKHYRSIILYNWLALAHGAPPSESYVALKETAASAAV